MIVKVQLPLSAGGSPTMLVYNERRTVVLNVAEDPAVAAKMPGLTKAYFMAELAVGRLLIGEPLPEYLWPKW